MTHAYKISGMTCKGCTQVVHDLLSKVESVKNVDVDLSKGEANIEMEKHVPTSILQDALADSVYQLSEVKDSGKIQAKEDLNETKKWYRIMLLPLVKNNLINYSNY